MEIFKLKSIGYLVRKLSVYNNAAVTVDILLADLTVLISETLVLITDWTMPKDKYFCKEW